MGWPYECKYCGSNKDSFMCMKSGHWFCSDIPCKDSYWFQRNGYHWCEICEQMERWSKAKFYDSQRKMWLCSERCADIYDSLEPDRQYWAQVARDTKALKRL
jgi:hypothetical protein